jgi:hypothetical protein
VDINIYQSDEMDSAWTIDSCRCMGGWVRGRTVDRDRTGRDRTGWDETGWDGVDGRWKMED